MEKKLKKVFIQMGVQGMYELANPAVMEIINTFNAKPNREQLAEIIFDIYGEEYFLSDSKRRRLVLQYLGKNDAASLCAALSIDCNGEDPWSSLENFKFKKQSIRLLISYFGVSDQNDYCEEINTETEVNSVINITGKYSLFEHQYKAAKKTEALLKEGKTRVLLHMPTGSGKTRTTMNIVADFLRRRILQKQENLVLWLADTEELCDQAANEFLKAWSFLGAYEIPVYRFYGDFDQSLDNIKEGFLVAGVAKLNRRLDSNQSEVIRLGMSVGLVVFDEAHKVIAPTYQHIVSIVQETGSASLIGLSATPGRSTLDEQENEEFANFFNRQKVKLEIEGYDNPIEFLQETGYLAKINQHKIPYNHSEIQLTEKQVLHLSSGNDVSKDILEKLSLDSKRNIIIINTIVECFNCDKSIIVFACSVSHAEAITALLKYKDISAGLITGNTSSSVRKGNISKYKKGDIKVLVNYGVLTTGFDAPNTNVAVIARPTTSLSLYSQMIGRAARGSLAGGNDECDIYTVVDSIIPGFNSIVEAFNHWDDSWEIQ